MDRDALEEMLSKGLSLAEIGRRTGRHEATVSYWMRKYGLTAVNAGKHAARGAIDPVRLGELVEQGCTIAEIAHAVDRSKATVRHWLKRNGLKTWSPKGARRRAESVEALDAGLREASMACARHGMTDFVLDGRGYYRCRRCRAEAVSRRRRRVKALLVAEAGGACAVCGYRSTMRALHFHHVDPTTKRIELNARGGALSLETLREEARKCVLLCSNCHAEVESGARRPMTLGR
jgi:transposase